MCKVSIIMPIYNVASTVNESIDSALAQTFSDFELIIVDDGGPDNSYELCVARAEQEPRIRIIRQQNKGLAGARNTGIQHARGEYLAFLDSDDLWTSDKLERHVKLLDSNPEIGLSYNGSEFIDDDSNSLGIFQTPKIENISAGDVITRNPVGNGSAPVIRAETMHEIKFKDANGDINYFDSSLRQSEDIECWVRIITTTDWKFSGIDAPLTKYRVNEGGLSANVDKQFDSWMSAFTKMQGYAPEVTAKYGNLAKAYQYRYLARRAIRSNDRGNAFRLCIKSLATSPGIIVREPGRTALTLAALAALLVLPPKLYTFIEKTAMSMSKIKSAPLTEMEEEEVTA